MACPNRARLNERVNVKTKAQRAPWLELAPVSTVWAPFGNHGWRPATVTSLDQDRGNHTVAYLHFDNDGSGQRYAWQLFWRKPELKGNDKPHT